MPPGDTDEAREIRIQRDIIVDANGPEEQASGWYNYLADMLAFPFLAHCVAERAISPLQVGDEVELVGMGPEAECQHEMFVLTPWGHDRTLAIPLAQVEAYDTTAAATAEAVADWRYWVRAGYEL